MSGLPSGSFRGVGILRRILGGLLLASLGLGATGLAGCSKQPNVEMPDPSNTVKFDPAKDKVIMGGGPGGKKKGGGDDF